MESTQNKVSAAQSFDGSGDVYIYTRVWQKTCPGCAGYGRGITRSTDVSFDSNGLKSHAGMPSLYY
jgi:hypothetical protein